MDSLILLAQAALDIFASNHLNNLKGYEGWFTTNYGGLITDNPNGNAVQPDGKKRPWQKHNTMRLDAIRDEIDKISDNEIEKSVLLTSLIIAMDKVDNGLGHQVSYLKDWSPRSSLSIKLEVPELIKGEWIKELWKILPLSVRLL